MRFAVRAFGVFSFVATFALPGLTSGADESLATLLERSRAASGAPYRYHVVNRSTESRAGRDFDVTTETEGLKYRARRCRNSICSGFYFDGERSFETNFNDTSLPASSGIDPFQITLRAIASYAFTAPDFRRNGGVLVEREPAVREGKRYRRISVTPPSGAKLDALIDPASALVTSIVAQAPPVEFTFADQRKVSGKLELPFTIFEGGEKIERFDERAIVADALPAPRGLVPQLTGGTTTVGMLDVRGKSTQPIVPCTIAQRTVACLLDTGNSGLALSLDLAEKLGLEPNSGALDVSGVGTYVTGVVDAPELTVGDARYPAARYVILHDLGQYGYDVVLGADAFANVRVTFDYRKRTVTIATDASATEAPRNVPLTFEKFLPVARLRFGELTVPLGVDSGDETAIDLSAEYYAAHRSIFSATGSGSVAGIGGSSDQVTGSVANVGFGPYELATSQIAATKRLPGSGKGHIGSALLSRFITTFDYARQRLELTPLPGDATVRLTKPAP